MSWRKVLRAAALWWMASGVALAAQEGGRADFRGWQPSAQARQLAGWVLEAADHGDRPFAIVDKKDARIYVFEARGRLLGASPALLGQALGDDSAPGVGQHAQTGDVAPHERTTPAGRFESRPGTNRQGEAVVWVDWASAFAIHRLRPGAAHGRRKAALAAAGAQGKRMSLGCVVVPVAFYERVVQPVLGRRPAVVYVLPETRPAQEVFGQL